MKPYYDEDGITIYHGNALDFLADPPTVDVIITDPPYGIGWSRSDNKRRKSVANEGIAGDEDTHLRDQVLAYFPSTPAVVFGSFYVPPPDRLRQVLVWQKAPDAGVVGSTTGYRRDAEAVFLVDPWPIRQVMWSSVLTSRGLFRGAVAAETGHPHAKPVDLMRMLIDRSPEGVILDPFMGSGTTLRAAKDLGRKAIGIEVEERHCETAAKRLGQGVFDFSDGAAS